MKLLYLMVFERVVGRGVIQNQVVKFLAKIKEQHGEQVEITLMIVLPLVIIGRREIVIPFFHQREGLNGLRDTVGASGIKCKFYFLPTVKLRSTSMYLNIFSLPFLLILTIPFVSYGVTKQKTDIIHCRSYLPTLCALITRIIHKPLKVIFDPRGFYPEEGVAQGRWGFGSCTHQLWKQIEGWMFRKADHVIALSHGFKEEVHRIANSSNCTVIHASVDTTRFLHDGKQKNLVKKRLGFEDNVIFVHNGSLGGSLHDPVVLGNMFLALKAEIRNSKLLMVTNYNADALTAIFTQMGISEKDFLAFHCRADQVPEYLMASDFGMVPLRNIEDDEAMKVTARTMIGTKVAEYLAAGLPLIVNTEVRGLASIMQKFDIGVWYDAKNPAMLIRGVITILNNYKHYQGRCKHVARNYFDMSMAADKYCRLYEQLLAN